MDLWYWTIAISTSALTCRFQHVSTCSNMFQLWYHAMPSALKCFTNMSCDSGENFREYVQDFRFCGTEMKEMNWKHCVKIALNNCVTFDSNLLGRSWQDFSDLRTLSFYPPDGEFAARTLEPEHKWCVCHFVSNISKFWHRWNMMKHDETAYLHMFRCIASGVLKCHMELHCLQKRIHAVACCLTWTITEGTEIHGKYGNALFLLCPWQESAPHCHKLSPWHSCSARPLDRSLAEKSTEKLMSTVLAFATKWTIKTEHHYYYWWWWWFS